MEVTNCIKSCKVSNYMSKLRKQKENRDSMDMTPPSVSFVETNHKFMKSRVHSFHLKVYPVSLACLACQELENNKEREHLLIKILWRPRLMHTKWSGCLSCEIEIEILLKNGYCFSLDMKWGEDNWVTLLRGKDKTQVNGWRIGHEMLILIRMNYSLLLLLVL
jgi:hypothetical protein